MAADTSPVWFITGCSSGFGQELARQVLRRGWRVVVSARDKRTLAEFASAPTDRCLALELDVTVAQQIGAAVAAAEGHFGRIDLLVNNAGYGYQASAEEGDEAAIRAMFDTNVFGLFALTRAVLPGMRARRSGHVINISSVAGLVGFAGSGFYAASKHAVEGWSDALAAEGRPLGIKVTCVEPGPFRTEFAGRSIRQTPNRIADYEATAGLRLKGTVDGSGSQPGDPARAAKLILALSENPQPPRHIVLGAFGFEVVCRTLEATLAELRTWAAEGRATDFPKGLRRN